MEAETGVVWPQAKGCWQPSEAGRGKEQMVSYGTEGSRTMGTPAFGIAGLHNCERINLCCFKPPSLQ